MADEFQGIVRVRKWSHCWVIILPKELREFFGLVHRDMIAYRKVGRYVLLRKIGAGELLPVSESEARRVVESVES